MKSERSVWIVSAAVGLLVWAFVPIVYMGDSGSYLKVARIFAGQMTDHMGAYFRTPGYPCVLLATGVVWWETFRGLLFVQLATAVAIPGLLYRIVAVYSVRVAWGTAMLAIASLVPYGYAKAIMTEHLYIVALLLVMGAVSRAVKTGNAGWFYAFAAALCLVQWLRPVGTFLFLPCGAMLFWSMRRRGWRAGHVIVALAFIPTVMHETMLARNAAIGDSRMATTMLNPASGTGKQLFYNVYLTGGHANNDVLEAGGHLGDTTPPFITDAIGPGATALRQILEDRLAGELVVLPPEEAPFVRAFFFDRFAGRPAALVHEMLTLPSVSYYWYLWRMMDDVLGPQAADRLFVQVSLEILRAHPRVGFKFLSRNLYFFASGVSLDYVWALHPNYNLKINQSNLGGLVAYTPVAADGVLSPALAAELAVLPPGATIRRAICYDLWTALYLVWRPMVFVGLLLGPWLLWRTPYAPVACVGAVVVLYHMAVVCVFCMPADRYVAQTILVELVVAGPAWVEAAQWLRRVA